jgi:holliday junction DNA helicase RuvA
VISRLRGTLVRRDLGVVEVFTSGGVAYEVEIPLTVYEHLPREGAEVELRTAQVVREDAITLYGFLDAPSRNLFVRLLTASGVGPRLALGMLSAMPPERLVRTILDRDTVALRRIPGLGTKKAEKLVIEMNDRLGDLDLAPAAGSAPSSGTEEAVGALVALGYTRAEAAAAVREALDAGGAPLGLDLIKAALTRLGSRA